jgi:hypothetical protein
MAALFRTLKFQDNTPFWKVEPSRQEDHFEETQFLNKNGLLAENFRLKGQSEFFKSLQARK